LANDAGSNRVGEDTKRDARHAGASRFVARWDWRYAGMPLASADEEVADLDAAVATMLRALDGLTPGDRSPLGPLLHVAHILKSEQGPDGLWPARINARTGEAIGRERTSSPVELLRGLDHCMNGTEFERCYARPAETEGDRGAIAETRRD